MTSRSFMRRGLSWDRALSDMRRDRATPAPVREERLRVTAGLRTPPFVALSAWRGRSGRRYVVQVLDLADAAASVAAGAVILGVRRSNDGSAVLLGAGHAGTLSEAVELAGADGATEIHLHRLAETDSERDAIVNDLVEDD